MEVSIYKYSRAMWESFYPEHSIRLMRRQFAECDNADDDRSARKPIRQPLNFLCSVVVVIIAVFFLVRVELHI